MKTLKEAIAIVSVEQPAPAPDSSGLWLQLLGDLKALSDTYQSTHWRSMGDAYYGDHLLYQRLYEAIPPEIDSVAERALGVTGNDMMLDPSTLMSVSMQSLKTLVVPGQFASMMLEAERRFLKRCAYMIKNLDASGDLSDGVEDLLQGICSKHEEHVYLLSRRVKMK